MSKVRQEQKVLTVLLSGKVVTKQELEQTLKGQVVLSRMSTYMWEIRKAGGDVVAVKDGKRVTGYQLRNADVMRAKTATVVSSTPAATPQKVTGTAVLKDAPKASTMKATKRVAAAQAVKSTAIVDMPETPAMSAHAVDPDFDVVSSNELPDILKS